MIKKVIFIILASCAFYTACAATNNASDAVSEKIFSVTYDNATTSIPDNETLILYYSKTGSTRKVANKIHTLMPEAKLVEIKSGIGIMKAVFWLQPFNRNAEIEKLPIDIHHFKRIIMCSPIWFQKIASPARTAITTLPMKNKHLHLFITCGGHFGEGGQKKLKKLADARGIHVMSLSIIKTGGKSDSEIHGQAQDALKTVLPNLQTACY